MKKPELPGFSKEIKKIQVMRPVSCIFRLTLGFCLGCFSATWPKPRVPGLLYIPTADFLPHGQFNASANLQFFTAYDISETDTSEELHFPYSAGVIIGLQDRAQFGIRYGDEVSFSFKSYVYESSGADFIPDVAVGVRSLFGSQEGRLFGVDDKSRRKNLRNEAYVAASFNVAKMTRLHLGGSALAGSDEGTATAFAGLEQYIGMSAYMGYEVFQRYSDFHHHLIFVYKLKSFLSIAVGLAEVQSWLVQNDSWGFYSSPEEIVPEGYNSPGVRVSFSFGGWAVRGKRLTERTKLQKLQQKQRAIVDSLSHLEKSIKEIKKEVESVKSQRTSMWGVQSARVNDYLDMIMLKINSDAPYDPKEVAELQKKVLELRGSARAALKKIVINPASDVDHRAQACIIMALSNRGEFIEPLLKATADPEPKVRREAILALGRLGAKVALEFAETLLEDIDETVQMAAKEAIRMIKTKTGEEAEEKEIGP